MMKKQCIKYMKDENYAKSEQYQGKRKLM